MRLFIAGEGSDEIGDFALGLSYRPSNPRGGIVEALLRQVVADGWRIENGCLWRRIRKYAVGRDLHGRERRNVLGLVDVAVEAGCTVVTFVRDRDGESDREAAIESAIAQAGALGLNIKVIGGTAVEAIDAWILACLGEASTESKSDPKSILTSRFRMDTGAQKTAVVSEAKLDKLPNDARSLRAWLKRAAEVLVPDSRE